MPDDELMSKIILESRQIAQLNQKLEDQLHATKSTANKLKEDVALLQNKYADHSSDSRLKFLEQELEEKIIQIGRLQDKLKHYELERQSKDSHLALLQGEIAVHKDKLSHKTEIIGELGRNLQLQREEFEKERVASLSISKDVQGLRDDLTSANKRMQQMHSMISQLEDKLKEMAKREEAAKKELASVMSELKRASQSNDSLSFELRKAKKNAGLLIDDLRIKDKVIQDTRRKQMERQKGISLLSAQLRQMQEKMKILDETNDKALNKLNAARATQSTLEEELAHQREINSKMQLRYEALLRLKDEKHATRIKALIADHTKVQLGLKTELEVLKNKLKPKKEEIKPLRPKEYEHLMDATPDELVPMIKTAFDHGDSEEEVLHSLITSGYEEKIIKKAIEKINLRV